MELKQLFYFQQVCKDLNLTRASEHCYITQQAMSKAIQSLEEELHTKLFHRTHSGMTLTSQGSFLREQCLQLFQILDSISDEILEFPKGDICTITLSLTNGSRILFPFNLTEQFGNFYSDYQLLLHERKDGTCLEDLETERSHGAISILPRQDNDFCTYPVLEESVSLAVHYTHPLAKKESLDLMDLATCKLILIEPLKQSNQELIDCFIQNNLTPNIAYQVPNLLSALAFCQGNKGTTLIINRLVCHLAYPELRFVPIKKDSLAWKLFLILNKKYEGADFVEPLLQFLRKHNHSTP